MKRTLIVVFTALQVILLVGFQTPEYQPPEVYQVDVSPYCNLIDIVRPDDFPKTTDPIRDSVSANGITMDLLWVKSTEHSYEYLEDIEDKNSWVEVFYPAVEVAVCFIVPDAGDWQARSRSIRIGGKEYPAGGPVKLGEFDYPDGTRTGKRCMAISFSNMVDKEMNQTPPILISIDAISPIRREMPACEELLCRMDTNPMIKENEITANCSATSIQNLMENSVLALTGYNAEKITAEEAQKELNRIAEGEIIGPWQFEVDSFD